MFVTKPIFVTPILPNRPTSHQRGRFVAAHSGDQWEQYERRNKQQLLKELGIARDVNTRNRHHHVFLNPAAATKAFYPAAKRFMSSVRASRAPHPHDVRRHEDERLWVLEATADDTFGTLRGSPYPPRAVVMESLETDAEHVRENDWLDSFGAGRWVKALDRAGKAFSPTESHYTDYAVWGGASATGRFDTLDKDELVACEFLNADWTDAVAISRMRDRLLSYAEKVVCSGAARMYQVLQSVEEPTVFKTVEVYANMEDLREHMQSLDPGFAEDMLECRAAVNRVRQLHRYVEALHGDS